MVRYLIAAALILACLGAAPRPPDYSAALQGIAADIEGLKGHYPQLQGFSAVHAVTVSNLSLSYGFHTHQANRRGGWTAGVPNPDDDGIWFYIDFHRADSTAQIDTQPAIPLMTFGDRIVSFLILQGQKTSPVAGPIRDILRRHGVQEPKT